MASRIQGITVEIGGDTTKLQTALKGVNSSIKSTQQQLSRIVFELTRKCNMNCIHCESHSYVIEWRCI